MHYSGGLLSWQLWYSPSERLLRNHQGADGKPER